MATMTVQQKRDAAKAHFNAYLATCPSRRLLDRIADKWGTLVISALGERPMRFSELSTTIAGVSQKMLTQALRGLERDGMLTLTITPSVPVRVDYALTPLGDRARQGLGRGAHGRCRPGEGGIRR
jgi:DNA-binding HxlR family transcriptional regulator